MTNSILRGKREICNFMGKGWAKIESYILTMGFPAKRIDGVWESDSGLITAWRRGLITGGGSIELLKNSENAKSKPPGKKGARKPA